MIPETDPRRVAIHEAGHVVAGLIAGDVDPTMVTIRATEAYAGYTESGIIPVSADVETCTRAAYARARQGLGGLAADAVAGYAPGWEEFGWMAFPGGGADARGVAGFFARATTQERAWAETQRLLLQEVALFREPRAWTAVLQLADALVRAETLAGADLAAELERVRAVLFQEGAA